MRHAISILIGVVTTLLVYGLLLWLFPEPISSIWVANRWLGAIAIGLYVGNLTPHVRRVARRWLSTCLFFSHAGLWVGAIFLLTQWVPSARDVIVESGASPTVVTQLIFRFAVEPRMGAAVLVLALFLLINASLSLRITFAPGGQRRPWMIEAVSLLPVLMTDVLVVVSTIGDSVRVINSLS